MKKILHLLIVALLVSIMPATSLAASEKVAQWSFMEKSIVDDKINDNVSQNKSYMKTKYDDFNNDIKALNESVYNKGYYITYLGANGTSLPIENAASWITSLNDGFTVEMWVKPEVFSDNRVVTILKGSDTVMQFGFEDTGNVYFTRKAEKGIWFKRIPKGIVLDRWNHIVFSFGSTDVVGENPLNLQYFVNGVDKTSEIVSFETLENLDTAIQYPDNKATVLSSEDKIIFGGFTSKKGKVSFGDSISIYKGQLSQAAVKENYNSKIEMFNTVYDVRILKNNMLVLKNNLNNVKEGNVQVKVTIPNSSARNENNVYIINRDTNEKIEAVYETKGEDYILKAPDDFMEAGNYQVVVANQGQTFNFSLKGDKTATRPVEEGKMFDDLVGFEWAEDYINKLAQKKIVNGKAENKYAPKDNVTRFEFVAMLSRAFNIADEKATMPFNDVESNHWAYNEVKGAYALGIISGVDDVTFDGNAKITREAMAAIVYRYLKSEKTDASVEKYQDDELISDWAKDAVYKMKELGLMNGKDGNSFDAKGFATRAETAALICRMLEASK